MLKSKVLSIILFWHHLLVSCAVCIYSNYDVCV